MSLWQTDNLYLSMIKSYSFLVIATLFIFDLTLVLWCYSTSWKYYFQSSFNIINLIISCCFRNKPALTPTTPPPNPPHHPAEIRGGMRTWDSDRNPAYQYKNDQKMTSNTLQGQTKKVGDVRESPFLSSLLFFPHPCLAPAMHMQARKWL